jgi:uncharacterized coiled-coil protein SlyX
MVTIRRKDEEIEKLNRRITELEMEAEKFREEIKHLQMPKWAKPNKKEDKKKNKTGPKKSYKANIRRPIKQKPDQKVVCVPEVCLDGWICQTSHKYKKLLKSVV